MASRAKEPLEYEYFVDETRRIETTDGTIQEPIGRISAGGDEGDWYRPFRSTTRDLVRVGSSILHADRLSVRKNGRGIPRELQWGRRIRLRIAVEQPEVWEGVAQRVERMLYFLSDDRWTLSFEPVQGVLGDQRHLFECEVPSSAEVGLLSGGLDSATGTLLRAADGFPVVSLSVWGSNVRKSAQDKVASLLRNSLEFSVSFRNQLRGGRKPESTQRTRGFFFLAAGVAVAHALGLRRVAAYEPGFGCLNPALTEAQVGAYSTRALHPGFLDEFENLVAHLLDRRISVELPFFFQTKGELLAQAGRLIEPLCEATISCDEGERGKPTLEHCGLCTSCLLRKVAVAASGANDPSVYRNRPTRRHDQYETEALRLHALRMREAARDFDALARLEPDILRAVPYWGARGRPRERFASELCDLARRYAAEILDYLPKASVPQYGGEARWR